MEQDQKLSTLSSQVNELLSQQPSGFLPRCYYGLTRGSQTYRFVADTVFSVLGLSGQVGDAFEFISPTETTNYIAGIGILRANNQIQISIQGDYNLNVNEFDIVNMRTGAVLSSYDLGMILSLQDASYLGEYDAQTNVDKQITVLYDLEINKENVIFASVDFNSDGIYNWVRIGGYSNGVDGHNIYSVVNATASAVFGSAHIGDTVVAGEAFTYDGLTLAIGDMRTISTLSPLALTDNGNIRGPQGETGATGADGADGANGYTPYIQDGNWYINGVDTGVVAVGQNGTNGQNGQSFQMNSGLYSTPANYGETGNIGPNSEVLQELPTLPQSSGMTGYAYVVYDPLTTPLEPFYDLYYANDNDVSWTIIHPFSGIKGQDGTNGETPYIQDNHWYIGGVDTGVQATGDTGATGADGATPTIVGGYWYINGVSTGVKAEGTDGTNGTNGTNGVTPNIAVSATQLSAGSLPTATRSGTDANPIITFGIPKGDTGATGPGVPNGGTTGQFLAKASNTDQDTTWITQKLDMLWENNRANTWDVFNAQTVSVYNPKGYKGFLILFIQYSTSDQINHFIMTTGATDGRLQDIGVDNDLGVRARIRNFSRETNGNYEDFTFEDGKQCYGSSAPTTSNHAAKPWQIYGFHRDTEV